jgi:hypothetical protein
MLIIDSGPLQSASQFQPNRSGPNNRHICAKGLHDGDDRISRQRLHAIHFRRRRDAARVAECDGLHREVISPLSSVSVTTHEVTLGPTCAGMSVSPLAVVKLTAKPSSMEEYSMPARCGE